MASRKSHKMREDSTMETPSSTARRFTRSQTTTLIASNSNNIPSSSE